MQLVFSCLLMGAERRRCFFSPMSVLFVTFFSATIHLYVATDTISLGQSLSGNQKIVSKEGNFVLGFFSPGASRNFYIGIWYKKIPQQTVIWVANRERSILRPSFAQLKLNEDGNLILLDHLKQPIWSSNSTSHYPNSTVAMLLDTGNLVLREGSNSSAIIWQSFDHPTDTMVHGSWIGMNKITGEYQSVTSWKNSEDPAPGYFSDTIDPGGTSEFFLMWNQSVIYWRSGLWNGHYFPATSILPEMRWRNPVTLTYIDNKERRYATVTLNNNSTIWRTVIDVSGQIKSGVWLESSQEWLYYWYYPFSQCDVYSICGPFGVCDLGSSSFCNCPYGFEQASKRHWELNDWSSGCVRKTSLQCGSNSSVRGKARFLAMSNMRQPSNPLPFGAPDAEACRSACLSNCSCTAYSYANGSRCLVWNELRNLQQLDDGDSTAETLYVRLSISDLPSSSRKHKTVSIIIGAVVGALILVCISLVLLWIRYRRRLKLKVEAFEGSVIPFTYVELRHMTKNFAEKLGGGGFGSVFKGSLPDSNAIAVKKLEGLQQGEKQFRAEVSTLGSIQHVNLIRLRGFCSEGTKRLLVYDYMPNRSLDYYLFRDTINVLDWNTRYKIILGIARGLSYLHEKCRECIIHCDIKPENILLDSEFCAKVADFGLAKLVGRDFSRVLTTTRGTIGYLAPEWIAGLPITSKADVYSYGMMLFEVISGRRNTGHSEDSKISFFPILVATKVIQGSITSLVDLKLDGNFEIEELNRVCRVACWCIQDCEADRPSMGRIVQILKGGLEVNVPPIPRFLQNLTEA